MPNSRIRSTARRAVVAVLGFALLALAGCAPSASYARTGGDDTRPRVLTTFTVLADMARAVGGDVVDVQSLIKVGAEVHGYEPTPDDLRRAAGADLILDNGLGLEAWFATLVAGSGAPHVTVSGGIEAIPIATGHTSGRANPHAWMSPRNALVYVANIERAFAALDPEHAAQFAANAAAYTERIRTVQDQLLQRLAEVPADQRVLVTCEGAFPYLARDAGLDQEFLWPVNSDRQGSPRQVEKVIAAVRDRRVPAVFCESTVPATGQREVAKETGARFGGVLYVDSLSRPDGPVPTYLDLLSYDTNLIAAALTSRAETSS